MELRSLIIDSPLGPLKLVASEGGLVAVLWKDEDPGRVRIGEHSEEAGHPLLVEASEQLQEYFYRRRQAFTVPLDMRGTEFQKLVWSALLTVPFGETRTYRDIARQIDRHGSVRAVGAANGRNPLSILVPCHRIIGASGELTGFAGGLDAKAYLLRLEGSRLF